MKNLLKAIAAFQQDCPIILKDTSGYGYKYADLTQIDSIIKPLLAKHGISYVQPLQGQNIQTILFHIETGEQIESLCVIPFESIKYIEKNGKNIIIGFEGMNTAQAYGSLITYFRRYTIASLLGLITDKDTDGTGIQHQKDNEQQEQKKPTAPDQKQETTKTQPELTPEQKAAINSWKENEAKIRENLDAVKTKDDYQIIKDNYPELLTYKPFIDLLKAKFATLQ